MSLALLIGDRHAGKTFLCQQLANRARARGWSVGGILAPAVYRDGCCVGYDVIDLSSGDRAALARLRQPPSAPGWLLGSASAPGSNGRPARELDGAPEDAARERLQAIGRFEFRPEGIRLGEGALRRAVDSPPGLVIADEVGPLELTGGGWADCLDPLATYPGLALLVVRRHLATRVAERWGSLQTPIYDLAQGPDSVLDDLLSVLPGPP